jgi:chromosomal replication initiation ATPase DnaA
MTAVPVPVSAGNQTRVDPLLKTLQTHHPVPGVTYIPEDVVLQLRKRRDLAQGAVLRLTQELRSAEAERDALAARLKEVSNERVSLLDQIGEEVVRLANTKLGDAATTEAILDEIAKPRIAPTENEDLTRANQILAEVARDHDVLVGDLTAKYRAFRFVQARVNAYWRLRTETDLSYRAIAALMKRDHKAIVKAVRKAAETFLARLRRSA